MKKTTVLLAASIFMVIAPAHAEYRVTDRGDWPGNWPEELEPLRSKSRTLVGPKAEARHYAIRFEERDDFEAAWQHVLQVKSAGAPIILTRGPNFFLGDGSASGVVVHCPPAGKSETPTTPGAPAAGAAKPGMGWMNTNYIELVVDGEIVDLNRVPLPADTPIIDERFKKSE